MRPKWLKWAKEMQAIAQAGLEYSKDKFDLDRFEQLRRLSVEVMHNYTDIEHEKLYELFAGETGYQTPKVDVRGVVIEDKKILMVKESLDRKKHNKPMMALDVYKVFVLCRLIGGSFAENIETEESGFFALDDLPTLSEGRNNKQQIEMCFKAKEDEDFVTLFD